MSGKHFALGIVAFGFVIAGARTARAACSSGLACEVCDVSNYSPTPMAAPLGPMTGDCTDQDIADFDTACLSSSSTSTTCSNWETNAPPACLGCLLTSDTAASWGAFVCSSTACSLNSAGCVDVATNTVSQELQAKGAGSCGDLINANFGCQDYACGACSTTDFSTCSQSAIANECASYVAPVESTTGACAAINADGSSVAQCFPQDETGEVAMATYICGGGISPPPDSGTTQPDSGTTQPDGGTTKSDSGTTKPDAGKTGDAGSDAGTFGGGKTGCHCDAAGGGGDSLALVAISGALAAALARRKRRA